MVDKESFERTLNQAVNPLWQEDVFKMVEALILEDKEELTRLKDLFNGFKVKREAYLKAFDEAKTDEEKIAVIASVQS